MSNPVHYILLIPAFADIFVYLFIHFGIGKLYAPPMSWIHVLELIGSLIAKSHLVQCEVVLVDYLCLDNIGAYFVWLLVVYSQTTANLLWKFLFHMVVYWILEISLSLLLNLMVYHIIRWSSWRGRPGDRRRHIIIIRWSSWRGWAGDRRTLYTVSSLIMCIWIILFFNDMQYFSLPWVLSFFYWLCRTKRMSIVIGPSSFASRKKKSKKNHTN